MKVSELIEQLKTHPQDQRVLLHVTFNQLREGIGGECGMIRQLAANVRSGWASNEVVTVIESVQFLGKDKD